MSGTRPGVGVSHATDMHAPIYYGVITDDRSVPWPKNRVHWHCQHDHRSKDEAQVCADREWLRRRESA